MQRPAPGPPADPGPPASASGPRRGSARTGRSPRSEEHTSELQSLRHLVCRLLLEKKKKLTCHDTHIYILMTALDMQLHGFHVSFFADAVASLHPAHLELELSQARQTGAVATDTDN